VLLLMLPTLLLVTVGEKATMLRLSLQAKLQRSWRHW
jgi:hypothetical protein